MFPSTHRTLKGPAGLLAGALGIALGASCGPPPGPPTAPAAEGLPLFGPADAALFDDTLDPAVFGVELQGAAPHRSRKLPDRTRQADSVVPVRVATVTRDASGSQEEAGYQLTFVPAGAALSGRELEEPMQVVVGPNGVSFPLLRRNDTEFAGTRLILFVRRYNEGGNLAVHWHGDPDTPDMRTAVDRAKLLGDVR